MRKKKKGAGIHKVVAQVWLCIITNCEPLAHFLQVAGFKVACMAYTTTRDGVT